MDMDAFRTEMRGEFARLRCEFAQLRGEVTGEFGQIDGGSGTSTAGSTRSKASSANVARTRTVVPANLGSMIGVAALVLAAVRLG
jgi:hypothetical protein